jgi:hypothetical protein
MTLGNLWEVDLRCKGKGWVGSALVGGRERQLASAAF